MYRTTFRTASGRKCGVLYALTLAACHGNATVARHLAVVEGEPVEYETREWSPVEVGR